MLECIEEGSRKVTPRHWGCRRKRLLRKQPRLFGKAILKCKESKLCRKMSRGGQGDRLWWNHLINESPTKRASLRQSHDRSLVSAASPWRELPELSSPSYLLQALRAACILVHIQVHKADLGKGNNCQLSEKPDSPFWRKQELVARKWFKSQIFSYSWPGIETAILPLSFCMGL